MKKRWMDSVLKTSKQPAPALPFHRSVRKLVKDSPQVVSSHKTA